MTKFTQEIGLEGRYRIVKRKVKDDAVAQDTGWFHNLITDNGLDLYGATSMICFDHMSVGTGNAVPAFTDTTLANRRYTRACNSEINNANTGESATFGVLAGGPPYVAFYRCKARFEAGEATGNISEVGIGGANNGTNLFSRSLVVDGSGNPVVITVLADEYLDVYYEIRAYYRETDLVTVLNVSGVDYTLTMRRMLATYSGNGRGIANAPGLYSDFNGFLARSVSVFPAGTVLGTITGTPTGGAQDAINVDGRVNLAYIAGSHQKDVSITLGPLYGNVAGGIQVVTIATNRGFWQTRFTPVIPKTAANSFNLVIRQKWARYVP